jgi:hypothetical protein
MNELEIKWSRYLNKWQEKYNNGIYPFNGGLNKYEIQQIKRSFYKLNAEHSLRQFNRIKRLVKTF